ncbi:L-fuculose-phosphate aldolase [Proteiniclasticum sp. C24MP]|uniref:L-fuculose-phosphate aldolase n=1 Tax=Proteiniclasticum sp. C24MP TaxID=3374101 RepID=UPI003754ED0D
MLLENERNLIVEYGKKMSASGLTSGTSGNISIYVPEKGMMAISPSGIGYFDTKPEDVVIMDLDSNVIDGHRKPSSEWALHSEMYKRKPDCRSVVHTHSMYCTVFASLHQPLRAVHYVLADAGVATVPCAPYRTFGTVELAQVAGEYIGEGNAVLLANHGMLACGGSIKSAYGLANGLEYCAELEYRTRAIGKPVVLDDEEMANIIERFKTYGQVSRTEG